MAIFDFKLACGPRTYHFYEGYIKEFRDKLYLTSFPREDEREPFENIEARVCSPGSYPMTNILLAVDHDNGKLAGGCITDFHFDCDSALPIYLVVGKEYRRQGLGGMLLKNAVNQGLVKHCFVEVDNPTLINEDGSPISPTDRVEIYQKWGFRTLPIKYYQPPLGRGLNYETNLMLMHRGEKLTKDELKKFLSCFYRGLGYEKSEKLDEMFEEIEETFVYL